MKPESVEVRIEKQGCVWCCIITILAMLIADSLFLVVVAGVRIFERLRLCPLAYFFFLAVRIRNLPTSLLGYISTASHWVVEIRTKDKDEFGNTLNTFCWVFFLFLIKITKICLVRSFPANHRKI